MNTKIALMITVVILFITVVVLIGIVSYFKNKYHDACSELEFEIDYKNTKIDGMQHLIDAECLKRHAFDALADYMIREFDNNPSLFDIQQKQNPITDSTDFTLNVRLLPYPNQSDTFETLCE